MKTRRPSLLQQSALGCVSLACWLCATALVQRSNGQTIQYAFTNLAGLPGGPGSADGVGKAAGFFSPEDVAVDRAGNVFVADSENRTIRKVTPAGVVTTLAGSAGQRGTDDGTGSAARFDSPYGIALDDTGNLYVADYRTIRKVTPAGVVTTLAGKPEQSDETGFTGDRNVDGKGSAARFNRPLGIAVDRTGTVYVSDPRRIRKVTPDGMVTTLAGSAGGNGDAGWFVPGSYADGTGSQAAFGHMFPGGIAVDRGGTIYVADPDNRVIRKVTPGGVVTTLAGSAGQVGSDDGMGSSARFRYPTALEVDASGNLLVMDSIVMDSKLRMVTPEGIVTTLPWGEGNFGFRGFAADTGGNLYVADGYNHAIQKGIPIVVPEPRFSSVSVNGGAVTAQVSGLVAGWTIIIESSANLRDWSPIQTNVASGASQTISRPINPGSPAEFLRATMK